MRLQVTYVEKAESQLQQYLEIHSLEMHGPGTILTWYQSYLRYILFTSDESEPSWLEPKLELKDFQLRLACGFFHSARNRKSAETSRNFDFF